MTDSIRLIHATRLLLDEPVLGAGTLSGEERRLVEDATIAAFHRIGEACIDKHVDVLILSGDTFDETSFTLRARATLMDGLETLSDAGVSIFITPGMMDSLTSWRRLGSLPDEVTLLGTERDAPIEITEKGRVIAVVNHLTPGTASLDPPSYKLSAVQIGSSRKATFPRAASRPGSTQPAAGTTSHWAEATSLARSASRMGSLTHPAAPASASGTLWSPRGDLRRTRHDRRDPSGADSHCHGPLGATCHRVLNLDQLGRANREAGPGTARIRVSARRDDLALRVGAARPR